MKSASLDFNPRPSMLMYIDLNSCFASIEQQANPHLRGKPIAVTARAGPAGCILAPSIEAKLYGVKVGMRVKEGRELCPLLTLVEADPPKYRHVHRKLEQLLSGYTESCVSRSIDEFVLNFRGYPALERGLFVVGKEIKQRIRSEVGDWLTVSIGIGPNRFTAKTASSLIKPDGLEELNKHNYRAIYRSLELEDLYGVAVKNAARLQSVGIHTVMDMYQASERLLRRAFGSIVGYYWYLRLRGWEIDDIEFRRRSYSNSYVLPQPLVKESEVTPILSKLVHKMSFRMRRAGYYCQGIHLGIAFADHTHWHHGIKAKEVLFDTRDIYRNIYNIFRQAPYQKPIRKLSVGVFNLVKSKNIQLSLIQDSEKKERVINSIDSINERWGDYSVTLANMVYTQKHVPDSIAFGRASN